MVNDFTFRGESASSKGIIVQRITNLLKPAKRVNLLTIAGRNGVTRQTDGTYAERQILMDCMLIEHSRAALQLKVEAIAKWLSTSGELVILSTPDRIYDMSPDGEIVLSPNQSTQSFQIAFSGFPFALSQPNVADFIINSNEQNAQVAVSGTAATPCVIRIKNTGTSPIYNIQIGHRKEVN